MTKQELENIFKEVMEQVYSEENITEVKKKIGEQNNLTDNGIQSMQMTIMTKEKLSRDFLFRVLEKALCKEP